MLQFLDRENLTFKDISPRPRFKELQRRYRVTRGRDKILDFKNDSSIFYEKNFDINQASICKAKFTKEKVN
jgi:hypothetical protein